MASAVRILAGIALVVLFIELLRLLLRVRPLLRALREHRLVWPGPPIRESSRDVMKRQRLGLPRKRLVPQLVSNTLGVVAGIVAMAFFALDAFHLANAPQRTTLYFVFALLVLGSLSYAARAGENIRQLDSIAPRVGSLEDGRGRRRRRDQPSGTGRIARFRRARWALRGGSRGTFYGPAPTLTVYELTVSILACTIWYVGQDVWLQRNLYQAVRDGSAGDLVQIGAYTIAFVVVGWIAWLIGLWLTPARPTATRAALTVCVIAVLAIVVSSVIAHGAAGLPWDGDFVARSLVAGSTGTGVVVCTALVGGSLWALVVLSRNPALVRLPKELRLRFWLGSAQLAGLATIGIVGGRIEALVALVCGVLVAGMMARVFSFVIGIPAGALASALAGNAHLGQGLEDLIGSRPTTLGAGVAALFLASALSGVAAAVLIGLATAPRDGSAIRAAST